MNERIGLDPHLSDAELIEKLCATKTQRELAEYIVRREAGWRKAARSRERPLQERLGETPVEASLSFQMLMSALCPYQQGFFGGGYCLEAVTNRENTMRGKVSALRHLRKTA